MLNQIRGVDSKEPKRESWMLELPKSKSKNFGLGPRTFSTSKQTAKDTKQDKSWTETPEQKAKRLQGQTEEEEPEQDEDVLEYMRSLKRDQEMEKVSKSLASKRGSESLMDLHSKKLKAEKKKAKGDEERRPFDRDVDLQANRFDDAQKAQMMKRAGQLDDRFGRGASKYL